MANESICCIEAKGHSSDISRLIKEVLNPESLNFNTITPMPSEIASKLNAKGEAGDAYGDWLRDNWGTKWDSPSAPKFEVNTDNDAQSSASVLYFIASGYESGGPQPIVAKLASAYPQLDFTYESACLNEPYGEYQEFKGGGCKVSLDYEGDAFLNFARNTFGIDPNDYGEDTHPTPTRKVKPI